MKVIVKIADIEVVVDRPKFYDTENYDSQERRQNLMNDTILPTIKEATERAKELYKLKKENEI